MIKITREITQKKRFHVWFDNGNVQRFSHQREAEEFAKNNSSKKGDIINKVPKQEKKMKFNKNWQ